jgi:hypothetical protein
LVGVERENGFWKLVVKDRRYSISTGKRLRLLGNDPPAADVSSFETQNDVRVDANIHHVKHVECHRREQVSQARRKSTVDRKSIKLFEKMASKGRRVLILKFER